MLSYDERPQAPLYASSSVARASRKPSVMTGRPRPHRFIWIVTGPAGCGKTTVAKYLAESLKMPYIEGDEYHPKANVEKMKHGIALTDADRWDWLVQLRQVSVDRLDSTNGSTGVVLTCSALKEKYRDVIRIAAYNDHDVIVRFIYLRADEKVLVERVRERQGHFMKEDMVRSQFSSLEEPRADKESDVLVVDVGGSEMEAKRRSLDAVRRSLALDGKPLEC